LEILYPGRRGALLNVAFGYTLILITIWSTRAFQRKLFWIDVAFFLSVALLALYQIPRVQDAGQFGSGATATFKALLTDSDHVGERNHVGPESSDGFLHFLRQRFRKPDFEFPPLQFSIFVIALGVMTAFTVMELSAKAGTLHPLFGKPNAVLHGASYLVWAVVQQWIQQSFFFARIEQVIHRGILASFTTAALFGLAHLPNPVLAPVTFVGGWFLSELYRRYRSVVPLGIAHGLVGLALALSVPDSLNHHMRVGLGYLHYMS
jgi:membrane protease YdiL (CAAX protease family)